MRTPFGRKKDYGETRLNDTTSLLLTPPGGVEGEGMYLDLYPSSVSGYMVNVPTCVIVWNRTGVTTRPSIQFE